MPQTNTNTNKDDITTLTTDGETTSTGTETPETTTPVETETDADKRIPYDRFKQKVDEANALKAKLAEFESAQAEQEREQLVAQNEYKTLYEQALQAAETAKQESLAIKKGALLTQAGYNEEQTKLLVKLVDGEDDEAIAESVKLLQATVAPQDNYADPSAFNGEKARPKVTDAEEIGRSAISKVLHKIKL